MGKSLRYENKYNFIVTAVFENIPKESSLQFDYVFNWDAQKRLLEWASNNIFTYVQFKKDTNIKQAEKKLSLLLDTKLEKRIGIQTRLGLQRFGDQYLFNHFVEGEPTGGRIEYIRLFKGAAIFILLLACINFMNLATARSVKRAKEVGLRKVVGSNRTSLIGQFFGESILCCALATILSAILLLILLPTFNGLTGKEMDYPFFQLSFWIEIISLVLITGIIAGMYPALYLSSLKPIQIVKGINCSGKKAILFRKTTTIFQFSLSSLLIIATVVISNQVSFIKNNNLGYDRENLLYVRIEGELSKFDKYQLFKQKASNLPGISMIDRSSEAPHEMSFETTTPIDWQGKPDNASVAFKPASVGFDFVNLMKLTITEGRNFSRNIQTDSADAFLVNEEAVRQMGYKDPLGKWVSAWNKRGHIIGVLKDFHTESLHDPIKPLILDVKEYEYFGFIIVRTKPNQLTTALANLEKVYNELNPNFPFMYQFADQEYENMYKSELTTSRLAIIFAILAIVISCLGLLGLVTFSIEQRIKEIGIRRIMGATISGIVGLLSKDFLKLVVISLFISIPLGYIWMNKWLNNFAYSIQLRWWMFFIAGMAVLIIALLTISIQVIQAASAKPVTSLREE
ncbi:FtsX-like permease family protein [Olivibacter sp. 47]|nr:FtsX-like permease family protein [Olivibacter sp. 47]MDM8174940.1 FtsX-like permease family protein [Olivibacter sp. 47]